MQDSPAWVGSKFHTYHTRIAPDHLCGCIMHLRALQLTQESPAYNFIPTHPVYGLTRPLPAVAKSNNPFIAVVTLHRLDNYLQLGDEFCGVVSGLLLLPVCIPQPFGSSPLTHCIFKMGDYGYCESCIFPYIWPLSLLEVLLCLLSFLSPRRVCCAF